MNAKTLKAALKKAKAYVDNHDPAEVVSTLELALRIPMGSALRREIEKAKEEFEVGRPEVGETLLEEAMRGMVAVVKLPKPFKFRPYRRGQRDGGPRPITNGDNANDAAEMLSTVRDAAELDDDSKLQDALTNFLHWCDREGVDFDKALEMARLNHEMER